MYKVKNNHNKGLLDEFNRNNEGTGRVPFNCRRKDKYSLDRLCNTENVLYQTAISHIELNNDGKKIYIGILPGNWKQRLNSPRHHFCNLWLRNQTVLSKYFWILYDQRLTHQINKKIVRQSSTANSFNSRYNQCIEEKK